MSLGRSRRTRPIASVVTAALVALAGSACEKGGNVRFNPTLYAPDVKYLSRSEVRSVMWELSSEIRRLGHQLDPPEGEGIPAVEVAATLRRMDRLAKGLDSPGRTTTEPLINQHIGGLRFDISRALRGVSLEPPNYFFAEELGESCGRCHELRDRGPEPSSRRPQAETPASPP